MIPPASSDDDIAAFSEALDEGPALGPMPSARPRGGGSDEGHGIQG